jgi:hypothetical protein
MLGPSSHWQLLLIEGEAAQGSSHATSVFQLHPSQKSETNVDRPIADKGADLRVTFQKGAEQGEARCLDLHQSAGQDVNPGAGACPCWKGEEAGREAMRG